MEPVKYHILSTKEMAAELVRQAMAHGLEIDSQPLISILEKDPAEISEMIRKVDAGWAVFTSAHAVRAVHRAWNKDLPFPWKICCLEGSTLNEVNSLFGGAQVCARGTYSRELAEAILRLSPGEPMVFFCGNRRRPELPELLRQSGIRLEEIIVYETRVNQVALGKTYDAILFFSPSGVDSFFSANQVRPETVCFAIGRTTAEALRSLVPNQVITGAFPSPKRLVEALIHHYDPSLTP